MLEGLKLRILEGLMLLSAEMTGTTGFVLLFNYTIFYYATSSLSFYFSLVIEPVLYFHGFFTSLADPVTDDNPIV